VLRSMTMEPTSHLHVSQPRKLLFIFPVHPDQFFCFLCATLIQLSLLLSALFALHFLLPKPGMS